MILRASLLGGRFTPDIKHSLLFYLFLIQMLLTLVGLKHIPAESIDPSIGRIDKSMLSQQTLLELVLSEINENKSRIMGDLFDIKPLSQWKQITMNMNGEVTKIEWPGLQLYGTISLQWLPESLEELILDGNYFEGTLECSLLPESLRKVDLCEEQMSGSLDLDSLPMNLEFLNVSDNRFSGEISLIHLPETLVFISLEWNNLSGTVNLERLPSVMTEFHVGDNKLCGTVSLTKLPKGLRWLTLEKNQFSGPLDMTQLPPKIEQMYLSENDFEGWTDFSQLPHTLHRLEVAHLQISGKIYTRNKATSIDFLNFPRDGMFVNSKESKNLSVYRGQGWIETCIYEGLA